MLNHYYSPIVETSAATNRTNPARNDSSYTRHQPERTRRDVRQSRVIRLLMFADRALIDV